LKALPSEFIEVLVAEVAAIEAATTVPAAAALRISVLILPELPLDCELSAFGFISFSGG